MGMVASTYHRIRSKGMDYNVCGEDDEGEITGMLEEPVLEDLEPQARHVIKLAIARALIGYF